MLYRKKSREYIRQDSRTTGEGSHAHQSFLLQCLRKISDVLSDSLRSGNRSRRPLCSSCAVVLLSVLAVTLTAACDGIYPAQDKTGPPDDHTVKHGAALHKAGEERPFSDQSGCSAGNCHHSDLRGGVADVDGRITVAPSCYQCHGVEWDN